METKFTVIRLARQREAEALANMSRQLIEHGLPWRWRTGRIHHAIRSPDTSVVVAEVDKQLAGFALMNFDETRAHLSLLAVKETYQGAGVARSLMNWLLDSCRVAGISRVTLEVRTNNHQAISFYTSMGFTKTGIKRGYYERREDASSMVLILIAPEIEKNRP